MSDVCIYQTYIPLEADLLFERPTFQQRILRWTPEGGFDWTPAMDLADYARTLLRCEVDGRLVPVEIAAATMGLSFDDLRTLVQSMLSSDRG